MVYTMNNEKRLKRSSDEQHPRYGNHSSEENPKSLASNEGGFRGNNRHGTNQTALPYMGNMHTANPPPHQASNQPFNGAFSGFTAQRSPDAVLGMLHSSIEYHQPADKSSSYFELRSPSGPEYTVRLYRPSMIKLCEQLPVAIARVKDIMSDLRHDPPQEPLDVQEEIAILNEAKNMRVKLYVNIYGTGVHIFARLYVDSTYFPDFQPTEFKNATDENDGPNYRKNRNDLEQHAQPQGGAAGEPAIHWVPTKRAVRFSVADNVDKIVDFVSNHY